VTRPPHLTNVNGTLFFTADDGTDGRELWKSDGTAAGTVLAKDINPGSAGSSPQSLTNVGEVLYFSADDGIHGRELWKSDGTGPGTVLVSTAGSGPANLTNVNGTLLFTASDAVHGTELWKSDGTAAGTTLVKDINPGSADSAPYDLTNVNGILFFSAADGVHGSELWQSDGTAAGTVLVADVNPGPASSYLSGLTYAGGLLYFAADDGTHGMELWTARILRLDLGAPSAATAGTAFSLTVTARDALDRVNTGYLGTVTFTSSDGTADLPGTYTFTSADQGVHTFTVTLRTAGSQTVSATDRGASSITDTATVAINPAAADHLLFFQQPSDTVAGQPISPAVTVEILDQFNNVLTNDSTDTVTLALNGGGTLNGTLTQTVSNGVATFADLSINQAGSGYRLTANSAGLMQITSGGFAINPAAADHLLFFQQPTNTVAGQTISPVIIEIVDQFGNVVTSESSDMVTLSIGANPSGGTLTGTLTITVTNGIATFSDLSIDLAGGGYTLHATIGGSLADIDSNLFDIT
jgi:ELWxxDGT repeat protein